MEHNHSLGTAEALYYTKPSRTVKQQFDEYFMGGMNVLEAKCAHQDYLELSEGIAGGKKKKILTSGRQALGMKRASKRPRNLAKSISLMRNHMVLVIKDKIYCLCALSFSRRSVLNRKKLAKIFALID